MGYFAPSSPVWDGGFFSVSLSGEPPSLPWLGGPAPSLPRSPRGLPRWPLNHRRLIKEAKQLRGPTQACLGRRLPGHFAARPLIPRPQLAGYWAISALRGAGGLWGRCPRTPLWCVPPPLLQVCVGGTGIT